MIPTAQFVDSWEVWYPRTYAGDEASLCLVPDAAALRRKRKLDGQTTRRIVEAIREMIPSMPQAARCSPCDRGAAGPAAQRTSMRAGRPAPPLVGRDGDRVWDEERR